MNYEINSCKKVCMKRLTEIDFWKFLTQNLSSNLLAVHELFLKNHHHNSLGNHAITEKKNE